MKIIDNNTGAKITVDDEVRFMVDKIMGAEYIRDVVTDIVSNVDREVVLKALDYRIDERAMLKATIEGLPIEKLVALHNAWIEAEDFWGYGFEKIYSVDEDFRDGVFTNSRSFRDAIGFFLKRKSIMVDDEPISIENIHKKDIKWILDGDMYLALYTDEGLRKSWMENYFEGYKRWRGLDD